MSKLGQADSELNAADLEDNDRSFFSDMDDDPDHPYFIEADEEAAIAKMNPKEMRDLAEGKNLNNSFVGPYPESWDHLHVDKGANPQFMAFNHKKEETVLDIARRYGLIK